VTTARIVEHYAAGRQFSNWRQSKNTYL